MTAACAHDEIDATMDASAATARMHFKRPMTYPEDPPGITLRRIHVYDLECSRCHKKLNRDDLVGRFDPGGEFYHPRFNVSYAPA
jgi:hypothetical protein